MSTQLGLFQRRVLSGVKHLKREAYGSKIRDWVAAKSGKEIHLPQVYATLHRLETLGMLTSRIDEFGSAGRRGRARRVYALPRQRTEDPIEAMVERALNARSIRFEREVEVDPAGSRLDFHLPDFDLFIECKQFHSERAVRQLSRAPNVILLQGREATGFFCKLLTET